MNTLRKELITIVEAIIVDEEVGAIEMGNAAHDAYFTGVSKVLRMLRDGISIEAIIEYMYDEYIACGIKLYLADELLEVLNKWEHGYYLNGKSVPAMKYRAELINEYILNKECL